MSLADRIAAAKKDNQPKKIIPSSNSDIKSNLGTNNLAKSAAVPKEKISKRSGKDRSALIVDVRELNIDLQVRNKFALKNEEIPELSDESIQEMADSINPRTKEIDAPLLVVEVENGYFLWDGHRRTLGVKKRAEETKDHDYYFQPAKLTTWERLLGKDKEYGTSEYFLKQLMVNNLRESIDPIREARILKDAIESGMSQVEAGKASGISPTKVSRLLKVFTYPESIQEMIANRDLPYSGKILDKALKEIKNEKKNSIQPVLDSNLQKGNKNSEINVEEILENELIPDIKSNAELTKDLEKKVVKKALKREVRISVSDVHIKKINKLLRKVGEEKNLDITELSEKPSRKDLLNVIEKNLYLVLDSLD